MPAGCPPILQEDITSVQRRTYLIYFHSIYAYNVRCFASGGVRGRTKALGPGELRAQRASSFKCIPDKHALYLDVQLEIRCVYASRNVHTENQSHPLYRVFVVSYRHQYINICVRK